jgi:hypothetical protein
VSAITDTFPYGRAPDGSPDRYRILARVTHTWEDVPERFFPLVGVRINFADGSIWRSVGEDGRRRIHVEIIPPFFFSVSVAPDSPEATVPASLHDWIYSHAGAIAKYWNVPVRSVLRLADHWFLALMRHTRFRFRRSYFLGVRWFGFWFNRLSLLLKGRSK